MKDTQRKSVFEPEFRVDLQYWAMNDRKILIRIFELIEAIMRDPFDGIGKPEPLRHESSGTWSRRISKEHRLVYRVFDERINFAQAKYHY
ncbi:MAG: Txe/YoeB family addiction module toxin [Blastocatellia bacterium]